MSGVPPGDVVKVSLVDKLISIPVYIYKHVHNGGIKLWAL